MPREPIERLWTRGREFLGVRYPILGGAMSWISESGLVAQLERRQIGAREAGRQLEEFWIGALRKAVVRGIVERLLDEAAADAEKILARLRPAPGSS